MHVHQLDRHADEADVLDVVGQVRAGSREAHVGRVRARRREDAAPHVRGQVVADDHLGAHDAVRLGVAAALEGAGPVGAPHVVAKARDDRIQAVLLVDRDPLLGEHQPLVRPPPVDQELQEGRHRLAQDAIERRTEERLQAALEAHAGLEAAVQRQQHRVPEAHGRRRSGGDHDRPGRRRARDVAQRPQPRQEEIAAAAHGHELRQTADPARRSLRRGMLNRRSRARPAAAARLPSSGSLSSLRPANLALVTQAFCTNSNWRAMLRDQADEMDAAPARLARPAGARPRAQAACRTRDRGAGCGGTGRGDQIVANEMRLKPSDAQQAATISPAVPAGMSPVRGLARRTWAPNGQRSPCGSPA